MRSPRLEWASLRGRLEALVVLVLVAILMLLAVALAGMWEATAADRVLAERLRPAESSLERLQSAYVDQETGLRGFLITGDETFLQPFTGAEPVIVSEQQVLRDGVPEQTPALDTVIAGHSDWLARAAQPMIALRRAGATEQADAMLTEGKSRFDLLRARIETLRTAIHDEAASAQLQSGQAKARVTAVLVVAAALVLLLAGVALLFVRRWVVRPLDHLVEDVAEVAGGDYQHPIRDDGLLELATVGRAVGTMRDRLTAHAARSVREERRRAGADEAERMASELREDVIGELSSITLSLVSASGRHPEAATELRPVVGRLDEVIQTIRRAIFDLAPQRSSDEGS